jgi:TonB family protein
MRIEALIIFAFLSNYSLSQKETYYKDVNFWKEVPEKKANYKIIEFNKSDTLLIQSIRIFDNLVLSEEKWIGNEPVGSWKKFDTNGNLISNKDFTALAYSDEPIVGIYDNSSENEDCENCVKASFPGGEIGLFKYLGKTIRYPGNSRDNRSSGKVYIRIIISKDGVVSAHSIAKGVDPFIDMESWQVVEKMPVWSPATKNGKPIDSYMNLPINFVLK